MNSSDVLLQHELLPYSFFQYFEITLLGSSTPALSKQRHRHCPETKPVRLNQYASCMVCIRMQLNTWLAGGFSNFCRCWFKKSKKLCKAPTASLWPGSDGQLYSGFFHQWKRGFSVGLGRWRDSTHVHVGSSMKKTILSLSLSLSLPPSPSLSLSHLCFFYINQRVQTARPRLINGCPHDRLASSSEPTTGLNDLACFFCPLHLFC